MIIHMNRRGFTMVELIIVITIMGVLFTLGVVNLRGAQGNGRDAERKIDVETIAQHLETYYTSGTDGSISTGFYPSTSLTASTTSMILALRDIDEDSITAPGVTTGPTSTFISATNATQTTAGVTPQPTIDQYVYQPIKSVSGTLSLCVSSEECRKYNLYYRLEVTNAVTMITSSNQ